MSTIDEIAAGQPLDALPASTREALQSIIVQHLGPTFPALVLTVIRQGHVWLNAAWGWLDPDTRRLQARTDTRFDLASLSKLFTTTAFLAQVSGGLVSLDAPLAAIIPTFAASGPRPLDGGQDPHTRVMLPVPDAARGQMADPFRVTLRHLLTHTSGLAPWRAVYQAAGPPPPPPDQSDPVGRSTRWQRALEALVRYPFVGQPGDGVIRYSDLGLMLLGEVIMRLEARPFQLDRVLADRVFDPLKLSTLTYNPLQHGVKCEIIAPTENDQVWRGRRCWGEVHDENACGVGGVAGHAGLFGTARDIAAFGQAWLAADARLGLSADVWQAAAQEQVAAAGVRRGLGWLLFGVDSPVGAQFSPASYGHTGFTGTSLWIDPARSLVVACLTNRVYHGRDPFGIKAFRQSLHELFARESDQV